MTLPEPGLGKVEINISLRVGKQGLGGRQELFKCVCWVVLCVVEAKNLSPAHDLKHSRDTYIITALDQEEIFRTATVEKSLRCMPTSP